MKSKNMTKKQIYIKAAKLVYRYYENDYKSELGACSALYYAASNRYKVEVAYEFFKFFKPIRTSIKSDSFYRCSYWWDFDEKGTLARTLALLFMAEMEDGK